MSATTMPTLEDVLTRAIAAGVAKVHTSLPGVVIEYDRTEQRATVRPVLRTFYYGPDGSLQIERLPVIHNVPVQWPSTSASGLTLDLEAGDPVTIVFVERSTDEWRENGGDDVTPQDTRRFNLGDCVALPGGRPFSDPLPSAAYAAGASVLWGDDVRLGDSTATDFVALESKVNAALSLLDTVLSSWLPVANDGGAALQVAWNVAVLASYPLGFPGQTGADKVKAT